MNKIWIIAQRELKTFFDSLIAYVILALFLGLTGYFTWYSGDNVFAIGQATLMPLFKCAYWTLFLLIPALTMKMFAGENQSGTIELLLTKAVTDWQVILGKFMAVLILLVAALLLTLPYYISISYLGDGVDHGVVITGYLGLFLMCAAYAAIGIWTSSSTNNVILAFFSSLIIGVFFHLLFSLLSAQLSGSLSRLLYNMSVSTHINSIVRGVVDSKDLIFFISITFGALLLTEGTLAKRHKA